MILMIQSGHKIAYVTTAKLRVSTIQNEVLEPYGYELKH